MSQEITDQQIDEAILAQTNDRLRKVASIIALASQALGQDGDDFYERIGERVRWLADNGRLEGAGDLTRWRHSEVRLPPQ